MAKLLIDDERLPAEVVDRIVEAVFREGQIAQLQPMLSVLALSRPEFLRRFPALAAGAAESGSAAFVYELSLLSDPEGHPEVAKVSAELARRLASRDPEVQISTDVLPSMVRNLAFVPHLLASVIDSLDDYRPYSWRQVSPSDLLAAIESAGSDDDLTAQPLRNYVADREADSFEGGDEVAFEEIRRRVREQGRPPEA
ncbi:hypothetical protein ACQPZJ_42580 [Actinoplanes sp. CA-054009]